MPKRDENMLEWGLDDNQVNKSENKHLHSDHATRQQGREGGVQLGPSSGQEACAEGDIRAAMQGPGRGFTAWKQLCKAGISWDFEKQEHELGKKRTESGQSHGPGSDCVGLGGHARSWDQIQEQ